MRVLVCGGREYSNSTFAFKLLDELDRRVIVDVLIEGGARGADSIGRLWALRRGVNHIQFKADWNKYGKGAGFIRNQEMLDEGKPDICVAFPGGNGTADMVRRCEAANIKVIKVDR